MTTIALLPAPPDRNNATTFSADSDTFFGALPTYGTQMSVVAAETHAAKLAVAGYCGGVSDKVALSSSTVTTGGATAVFSIPQGKNFPVGTSLVALSGSSYVIGTVTSYSGTTLTLSVSTSVGIGTYSSWVIGYRYNTALGTYANVLTASDLDLRDVGDAVVTVTGPTAVSRIFLNLGQRIAVLAASTFQLLHHATYCNLAGSKSYTCDAGDLLQLVKGFDGVVYVSVERVTGNALPVVSAKTVKGLFGYGYTGSALSMTNLVSNTGLISADTTGAGTARFQLAATGYGNDKAIFGYGGNGGGNVSMTNLVSNIGGVSADITGIGTIRAGLAAASYGGDKGIFGYGSNSGGSVTLTNLIANTGNVALDVAGVGTGRNMLAAVGYGGDKAVFGFGTVAAVFNMANHVSNLGVVSGDITTVGTAKTHLAAASYGQGAGLFAFGFATVALNLTNLVSNTGVVAADGTGVGTARSYLAATAYGSDKCVFAYGHAGGYTNISNVVSNTGVVASDSAGVGTARWYSAAAGFSNS